MPVEFTKAHAYGNDFLFIEERLAAGGEAAAWARAVCDRHRGIGADGLILYNRTPAGATMKLLNADGSPAEVSGNGVRCLAAIVADGDDARGQAAEITIETAGGVKTLTLLEAAPPRFRFRAWMGRASGLARRQLEAAGEQVSVIVLSVGNPQCIVLADALDTARFARLGAGAGDARGVSRGGRTWSWCRSSARIGCASASGSEAWVRRAPPVREPAPRLSRRPCSAGRRRSWMWSRPGGSQRVELTADGIYLTGWAELTARGVWLSPPPGA